MQAEALCRAAVDALENIKAEDIVVLDVRQMSSLFDYIIVASAESTRQTRALVSNLQDKIKTLGGRILGVEGEESGEWVLVDLGDVIVHVMQPAIRSYYNLEQLWGSETPQPESAVAAGGRARRGSTA
ncbi:MAG: ribosomal silencing factor RsfS [Thiotrichales bacterium SG8_50]|jgi:ribosome-associated protein|nr:MAG: ribosomal silencing factor RsfS [Thiotrichales bacterium SG8_50]